MRNGARDTLNSSDLDRPTTALEVLTAARLALGDSERAERWVRQNGDLSAFLAHSVAASNMCLGS